MSMAANEIFCNGEVRVERKIDMPVGLGGLGYRLGFGSKGKARPRLRDRF